LELKNFSAHLSALPFLAGGGEMGELIRSKDWNSTSIGLPETWPESLKISVSILLNSQFPMFVWWGEEYLTVYNDAYRIILGDKHPQALGASGPDVWKEIWDVVGPMANKVMDEGISNWAEDQLLYMNRRGHVEETYFTFSYSPVLDLQGKVGGVFCACTETTEKVVTNKKLKESEARFRQLADDSPMFVFIVDPDPLATVSYWNKAWLVYTGQSLQEGLGRAWNGILHPEDLLFVMKQYTKAYQNQESYLIAAVRVRRHDGEYRWHTFKGNPRYLANGEFSGYVGVGFDVHEQKIAEVGLEILVAQRTEDLQRTNGELQRSNQQLEEFAYAASHDLKEPIRKVQVFVSQLKDSINQKLTENEAWTLNRIQYASQRMAALVDDLLSYSHLSQRPREKERIELNHKVQLVLDDLELEVEQKKATIIVGELPVVHGYRRQMQQLFQNLISNSLKYSKSDVSPHIEINATEVIENGKPFYLIAVSDNGIGFEQQYADKIFQMFARLHGKSQYSGTGLGLSIVKKVVENHKGFIRVESIPEEGSIFGVYLPVE
jgi:PAS domain S-box-containing protein